MNEWKRITEKWWDEDEDEDQNDTFVDVPFTNSNETLNMRFNVWITSDGIRSKYNNYTDIDIMDTIKELIYFNDIRANYTSETLGNLISKLEIGKTLSFGNRWSLNNVQRIK